jgi:hypothetical protein
MTDHHVGKDFTAVTISVSLCLETKETYIIIMYDRAPCLIGCYCCYNHCVFVFKKKKR